MELAGSQLWKQFERDVGKLIFNGAKRNMGSGKINRSDDGTPRAGDLIHKEYLIECKCYAKIGIFRWWDKLKEEANEATKIPILCTKEVGDNQDILVTMHYKDFIKFKEAYELQEASVNDGE